MPLLLTSNIRRRSAMNTKLWECGVGAGDHRASTLAPAPPRQRETRHASALTPTHPRRQRQPSRRQRDPAAPRPTPAVSAPTRPRRQREPWLGANTDAAPERPNAEFASCRQLGPSTDAPGVTSRGPVGGSGGPVPGPRRRAAPPEFPLAATVSSTGFVSQQKSNLYKTVCLSV